MLLAAASVRREFLAAPIEGKEVEDAFLLDLVLAIHAQGSYVAVVVAEYQVVVAALA